MGVLDKKKGWLFDEKTTSVSLTRTQYLCTRDWLFTSVIFCNKETSSNLPPLAERYNCSMSRPMEEAIKRGRDLMLSSVGGKGGRWDRVR